MPIRINLKELFPADAQEITIDKINFNFNKLLALGVGEPGPIGLSGIQGSAGPVGGTGSQGTRGSTWIVDAGAPTITTGLLDGDLYLDSTALAVYQWDANTSTWNFLFDISAIVQNYLNAAQSPFVRGFGTGSPNDQRFIMFGNRDGNPLDDSPGSTNSTNDVLFLNNYYEDNTWPLPPTFGGSPDTSDFYNALLTISVDQRNLNATRSHIELGALYNAASPTLTSLDENFKLRFDRIPGSVHTGLSAFNQATFSLDIHDSLLSVYRNFSSVFSFQSPKYKPTTLPDPPINSYTNVFIGSRYGLDEVVPGAVSGDTLADGLVFLTTPTSGANIGVATKYKVPEIPVTNTGYINNNPNTQAYFMLDSVGSTTALFLNDKIYQNGGNIVQLGTTAARYTGIAGIYTPQRTTLNTVLTHQGNKIFTLFGHKSVTDLSNGTLRESGYNESIIENPNLPRPHLWKRYGAYPAVGILDFAGVADAAVAGDYMYVVKCLSDTETSGTPRIAFQTVRTSEDRDDQTPMLVGSLDVGLFSYFIDSAHRIRLRGNLAVITTNPLAFNPSVSSIGGGLPADGRVSLINITNPSLPSLTDSVATTKSSGSTASTQASILDMDVVDNWVYALVWEQTPSAPNAKVKVKVDVFSIEESDYEPASAITWKASTTAISGGNLFTNNSVTPGDYVNLSKSGAICANKKYIYAGYAVNPTYVGVFKIFSVIGGNPDVTSPPAPLANTMPTNFSLGLNSTLTLTVASAQINEISKIHQLGNSVYVLVNTAANGNHLIKVDVSDPGNPFQVWSAQIGTSSEYYNTFLIKGKHVYFAATPGGMTINGSTNSGLKAFEIDGFYTGTAHIESLRTEELDVTQNFVVGNNAIINNSLNVGGRAEITGEVGVGTRLRFHGGSYFKGNSSGNIVAEMSGSSAFIVETLSGNANLEIKASGVSSETSALKLINGASGIQALELISKPLLNLVQMNLDSGVDLQINVAGNKNVDIKSTGNTSLILENPGGLAYYNNNIMMYDGDSSVPTNLALRIATFPVSNYVAISGKNNRSLYVTTSGASNNMRADNADINIFTNYYPDSSSGNINISSKDNTVVNANKFVVNANNHYGSHSSPINGSINQDIFASGVFSGLRVPGANPTDTMILIWQRVGNVVRCTGTINYYGGDGGGPLPNTSTFQLPYYTNGASYTSGTSFLYIYGHGHGVNYGGNVYYVLPFGQRGGEFSLNNLTPVSFDNHTIRVEFAYDLL